MEDNLIEEFLERSPQVFELELLEYDLIGRPHFFLIGRQPTLVFNYHYV
jgi:hypothetical protein